MSQFDPTALPAPLHAYFTASDRRGVVDLFGPDAHVRDEGHEHVGTTEIAAWLDSVETRYQPHYVIESAQTDGPRTIVTFRVSGTFPGSPATLRQEFLTARGRIERLATL